MLNKLHMRKLTFQFGFDLRQAGLLLWQKSCMLYRCYMKKYFFFAIAICITCFIWGNSLLPVTESQNLSMGIVYRVAGFIKSLGITLTLAELDHIIRKLAHFSEFAAQGFFVYLGLVHNRLNWKWAALIGLVTGMLDETIQIIVPGRGSQVADVVLDWCGCWGGIVVGWIVQIVVGDGKI